MVASDFHLKEIETPAADLLLVAGDMTMKGSDSELAWYERWLLRQPQKHKVWIAGNHDWGFERNPHLAREIEQRTGNIYLEDSLAEVEGLRIWGSPVTPMFFNWAFMRDRGEEIRKHSLKIPENLDILLIHGPPNGVLDKTAFGDNAGCQDLLDILVNGLTNPPRYLIFGHIHEGHGQTIMETHNGKQIKAINASICDHHYQIAHQAISFDIEVQDRQARETAL